MNFISYHQIPFETIRSIIGEIIYGGRITDAFDNRTSMSLLKKFISPAALEENFAVTTGYNAPAFGSCTKDILSHIESFPVTDHPHLFGLHANADEMYQKKLTKEILMNLISVEPAVSNKLQTSSNSSTESTVLHSIDALLQRVPPSLDLNNAHVSSFSVGKDGQLNSLGVVCEHEVGRFNNLLHVVRESLENLITALKGLVVMSPQLDNLYEDIRLHKVPRMWQAVAYPSLKGLSSWFEDLTKRVAFIKSWLEEGTPSVIWIGGLFFPQGFITGMLQLHARKTLTPIDMLCLNTHILTKESDITKVSYLSVGYIYNLLTITYSHHQMEFIYMVYI